MTVGAAVRRPIVAFVVAGLAVAVALAVVVAPRASSSPDGLERVAADEGFASAARDHDLAEGPLADYGVDGLDDPSTATGVSGVIGIVVTFAVGAGLFGGLRWWRARSGRSPAPEG